MARSAAHLSLVSARSEVARARAFVADTLVAWGEPQLADDAVLLVSELVTNAVLHAGTAIVVTLRMGDHLRVEVADGSHALPQVRSYDSSAATGRGLQLVARVAQAWGVQPAADGKSVWFVVADPAREGAPAGATDSSTDGPDLDAFEAAGGWDSEAPSARRRSAA